MHTGASRIGRNNNKKNTLERLRDAPAAPPPQGWTTRASGLKGNRWTFPLCRALCHNPAIPTRGKGFHRVALRFLADVAGNQG